MDAMTEDLNLDLDPARDLSPWLQYDKDTTARRSTGGMSRLQTVDRYFSPENLSKDTNTILDESLARALGDEIAKNVPDLTPDDEAGGFGYGPKPLPSPADLLRSGGGFDAGFDRPPAPSMAAPLGTGRPSPAPKNPNALVVSPQQVEVPQVDPEPYKQASRRFYQIMEARPVMEGFPDVEKPGIVPLGLALLFSAIDTRHGGDYLSVPFQTQLLKRQQAIQGIVQKYQLDEKDWATAASMARQVMDSESDSLDRQRTAAGTAERFNASEQNRWDTERFKQGQINERQTARAGSAMSQLQLKLDRADNKKGAEIASEFKARREILKTSHPEWTDDQLDDKAAEYVNSRPELTMQQTAKAKVETTYLQRSLEDRLKEAHEKTVNAKLQGAYIKAQTKYKQELTRFLPQSEAFKWASLYALMDYRDRSIGLREEENDASLDQSAVKAARTAYEAANEEYEKYLGMLEGGIDAEGNAIKVGKGSLDFNTGAVEGDDETAAKIRRFMYFYKNAAMKAESTLDRASRDAQSAQGRAQERRKSQSKFRLPPFPGFVPGRKGEKPLDPTGGAFERPSGEPLKLGGDANPYQNVV